MLSTLTPCLPLRISASLAFHAVSPCCTQASSIAHSCCCYPISTPAFLLRAPWPQLRQVLLWHLLLIFLFCGCFYLCHSLSTLVLSSLGINFSYLLIISNIYSKIIFRYYTSPMGANLMIKTKLQGWFAYLCSKFLNSQILVCLAP